MKKGRHGDHRKGKVRGTKDGESFGETLLSPAFFQSLLERTNLPGIYFELRNENPDRETPNFIISFFHTRGPL